MRFRRAAIPLLALTLALGGCGTDPAIETAPSDIGATSDINPRPRDEVAEGGNLRLAIPNFPPTFNGAHIDADGYVSEVISWTLPGTLTSDAAGNLEVDHNYFTSIELTGTDPQRIVYTINPKAVWSDGSPITWADLRSQVNALSGRDTAYQVAATQAYSSVGTVERGVDDRQAIVTFAEHYAEWKGLFNPLFPQQVTATPQAFDDFYRNDMPLSAGPFMVTEVNRDQQRVILSRNPKWWGDTPKLDTVTYSILDAAAQLSALQNNELDAVEPLSTVDDIKIATNTPGVQVRRAPANSFTHITFNGAPGSIMSDPKLRIAISKGIDRQAIATAVQNGLVTDPEPLNNHLFLVGQTGYADNAQSVSFDPAAAGRMLDELGWKLNGEFREKDGRILEIRDAIPQNDTQVRIATIAQQNLADIGVKLLIETHANNFFTGVIDPGNFDIAQFAWFKSIFPLGALRQIYAYDPANRLSNFGRIGSPELNALIDETLAELDPAKAIELANKADRMIFESGFSLPIVQSAGAVAARENLANYGAFGLSSADFTKIGFVK
ncbi:ABC transporter family substrate-binding protein [Nocardia sp. NPDC059177]|uniref:ABC transporter family substrate-binding protein n=1 Tax=Nocardia sp. NPDC059177 TaxID=3346759 RepID=UPI0036B62605